MADYVKSLKRDLLEQFKGKEKIEALVEVVGEQLQEVYDFYEQLRTQRDVHSAVGKQLDGVGDIAVLTRMEAGQLAGNPIPFDIIDDETYRLYLIYKILKNTCDCTYPNIIKAFKMFWDRPLYYSEDPEQPATMIFDTGEMPGFVDTSPLFKIPLLRAAGVTLKIYARTSTDMGVSKLHIIGGLGYAINESSLPEVERDYDFQSRIKVAAGYQRVTEDTLPALERDYQFGFTIQLGNGFQRITEDQLPTVEREYSYTTALNSGSAIHSVMETPINGITHRE